MKVILGVDDSPYSQAILRWVKKSPWPRDTRFIVMSASPVPVSAYSLIEAGASKVVEEIQQEQVVTHQELVATVERDLQTAGLATEARVVVGDPRDVLVRTAERERADLIVVGSHGRTGLPRLLMGSVASYVASHAPCTVMIVKEPRTSSPRH